jgi:hypothetical protein
MEVTKLFDNKKAPLDWEYDGEADTIYISFGKSSAPVGVDVGLTIIGVGRRLEQHLKEEA